MRDLLAGVFQWVVVLKNYQPVECEPVGRNKGLTRTAAPSSPNPRNIACKSAARKAKLATP